MFTNLEINNDDNNEDIICPASLLCTVLPLTVLITLLSTITAMLGRGISQNISGFHFKIILEFNKLS